VPKLAIHEQRVHVLESGLDEDWQQDRKHHGGPERALCLFSLEIIQALQREGHPIDVGSTGENICVSGLDWSQLKAGSKLALGDTIVVEITRDAAPCNTIEHCFIEKKFTRISEKLHPGCSRMYARVLVAGTLSVGDAVRFIPA
jgi:MOSC domain-containing protein YiiM